MTIFNVTKMQGCGNDFIIADYDEIKKSELNIEDIVKKMCDRHFGIGADGFITINPNHSENADLGWLFYNSDGTPAQMCGNGMRCFAKYVYDKGIIDKKSFSVETLAGIIKPEILDNDLVKVNMGKPILQDGKIPFNGERVIDIRGHEFNIHPISMGNPHCVIFTQNSPLNMAQAYGKDIESHKFFPEKTNVEFVKIISETEIEMCVYERGCGITLACGTGACASTVSSILNNFTERNVNVNLPGGVLSVEWQGSSTDLDCDVYLTGPANYSFSAVIIL